MAQVLIAHRAKLYESILVPQLERGKLGIANRGEATTLAYQTAHGEITMHKIWEMHRKMGILIPDLVILTTLSAETAMARETKDQQLSLTRQERETGGGLSGKVAYDGVKSNADKLKRRELIHAQYDLTEKFLKEMGVTVLTLDTENKTLQEEVDVVLTFLQAN